MKSSTLIVLAVVSTFLVAFTGMNAATEVNTNDNNAINSEKDIVALAAETESLSTLVTAVKAADLVDVLQGKGPYTVFAPTNEAFSNLPEGTLENLLKPENKQLLVKVLTYHVVSGEVKSTDLTNGMTAKTVEGSTIKVDLGDKVKINDATVIKADVNAANGVVHVIDKVILPPNM